jgi:hypothetical protein
MVPPLTDVFRLSFIFRRGERGFARIVTLVALNNL